MNIFLAPHSDDETLFGSFIIQRAKPLIVVCTDGTSHERKFGIPIEQRRNESREAAKIMGVDIEFLGIAEEDLTFTTLVHAIAEKIHVLNAVVFAPTKTGGNPHHDIVSDCGNIWYGNYSKDSLVPSGQVAIIPTEEEKRIKEQALSVYTSQLRINPHHFAAVKGVPEYLSFKQC